MTSGGYNIPTISWDGLNGRLEAAAVSIVRFDARLEGSGLADGWQNRCNLTEAAKALLLDGHLVDLADLVLHDASMDQRSPTHELSRASSALRARRTALARPAPWPISIDGLAALRGLAGSGSEPAPSSVSALQAHEQVDDRSTEWDLEDDPDPLASHFAEIDALLARTSRVLSGDTPIPRVRSRLIYDEETDQGELEDAWLEVVKRTAGWPAVAASAIAWDAWLSFGLYPRQPWLGLILAGAVLRARGLTSNLLPLAAGYRASRYRPHGRETAREKVEAFCGVVEQAVLLANKDLDRLSLARDLMGRVIKDCRSNSKLPDLVSLFLSRPVVTMTLATNILKITPKAFEKMMIQLGGSVPRELTGRSRYRAWGIV